MKKGAFRDYFGCLPYITMTIVLIAIIARDSLFGISTEIPRMVLLLLGIFFFGCFVIGSGSRRDHQHSIKAGIGCVLAFCLFVAGAFIINAFVPHKEHTEKKIIMVSNGESSASDVMVYYVENGKCFHRAASCWALRNSEIVYKAYLEDVPSGREPCGICRPSKS